MAAHLRELRGQDGGSNSQERWQRFLGLRELPSVQDDDADAGCVIAVAVACKNANLLSAVGLNALNLQAEASLRDLASPVLPCNAPSCVLTFNLRRLATKIMKKLYLPCLALRSRSS